MSNKKVMYTGTAFHGENTKIRPFIHDLPYFDWQIKLLNFFKKNRLI